MTRVFQWLDRTRSDPEPYTVLEQMKADAQEARIDALVRIANAAVEWMNHPEDVCAHCFEEVIRDNADRAQITLSHDDDADVEQVLA